MFILLYECKLLDNTKYIRITLIYLQINMENEDNTDKLTEGSRSSRQMQLTLPQKIYTFLCSCTLRCPFGNRSSNQIDTKSNKYQAGLDGNNRIRDSKSKSLVSQKSSVLHESWDSRKQSLFKSVYEHANRLLQQYDESLDKSTIKKWHSYSIYEYKQNELLAIGTTKGRVLCKINCVRVQPSANAKKKSNQYRPFEKTGTRYLFSNFDKYWNKRYYLFQKFDEGISLDDQSWYSVTPEAVAQYIAGKIRCDTVLDGFCGAGGDSIKLSNTCSHVIANDISKSKLKCLETNAKVYCVENIQMLNEDFLQLEGIQSDIVYLSPPFGREQNLTSNSYQPNTMKPPLDKIFQKAITISRNIVMLLPPNINVQKLGQLIACSYINSGIPSQTCSVKIEKIFFMSQLQYLVVYLGSMIQNQINLNDELSFIYNYLREGEKKKFTHKKVIKYLREKYGMVSLLNYIFNLDKVQQSGTLIQKFYQLIRQKGLIEEQKLEKLIAQQIRQVEVYSKKKIPLINQNQNENQIMQEQKYVGEDGEKDVTLSYYSDTSGNKGMRDSKIQQQLRERKKSVQSSSGKEESEVSQDIKRTRTIPCNPMQSNGVRISPRSSYIGAFQINNTLKKST